MEPLHQGLNRVDMYDESKFEEIEICLDCGKLATDACAIEARTFNTGNSRIAKAKVYLEDIPYENCDCHLIIDFCETCNAVANDYCKKFAAVGKCTIVKRSLVKMTQSTLDDIVAAKDHGLQAPHAADNYIYLVDRNGDPVNNFKGLLGDKNVGISAPYLVCDQHTKQQWEDYLASLNNPQPSQPTDPTGPSDPTQP